uniref:Uncharacterized protein n=1 Tax=Caenorhabditis japonica TaxID=281687 RepID=A0A8R1DXD0_CAEJA
MVVGLMDGFKRVFTEHFRLLHRKLQPARSNVEKERPKSIFSFPTVSQSQNEGDVYFEMFNKTAHSHSSLKGISRK